MTIHWCGTGLSAIPGLRKLLEAGKTVKVWNRTEAKAREAVGDLTRNIAAPSTSIRSRPRSRKAMWSSPCCRGLARAAGGYVHQQGAHFVSSSYIAPEMRDLHARALVRGVPA
jgi:3-hydroxyisobutyrate dehydrogenase-like beta-hydroxyacid dehydrogenase